jgi:eight-cysteine-cluster-containing protein
MMKKLISCICALAALVAACGEPESIKAPVDMPEGVTTDPGKADWRTTFYTDFRREIFLGDTTFDTYATTYSNYYFGYEIELEAGDIVDFRVGAADGSFDPVIGIYGPQRPSGMYGNVVAVNDDSPEGGTFDSYIQFEVATTGRYVVIVREYGWRSGDLFVSATCAGGTCDANQCGDVMCALYCEHGFQKDDNGCDMCACANPPVCYSVQPPPNVRCAQVITWGKDPATGTCCQYPSPCNVPGEYDQFASQTECESEGPAQLGEACSLYGRQCAAGLECNFVCPDGSNDPGCNTGINPSGTCELPAGAECVTDADCFTTGCSGQVCAAEQVFTTCEYRPEYACYQQFGSCGCNAGSCGWAQTNNLTSCLAGN